MLFYEEKNDNFTENVFQGAYSWTQFNWWKLFLIERLGPIKNLRNKFQHDPFCGFRYLVVSWQWVGFGFYFRDFRISDLSRERNSLSFVWLFFIGQTTLHNHLDGSFHSLRPHLFDSHSKVLLRSYSQTASAFLRFLLYNTCQ